MVTNLSRVVHYLKMTKINERDKKLKLLPLLTETIYSFEIFSEHLWLLLESKNSYLCHVTEWMTSSSSFQLTSNGKKYFHAFDQSFWQFLDKAIQKPENLLTLPSRGVFSTTLEVFCP